MHQVVVKIGNSSSKKIKRDQKLVRDQRHQRDERNQLSEELDKVKHVEATIEKIQINYPIKMLEDLDAAEQLRCCDSRAQHQMVEELKKAEEYQSVNKAIRKIHSSMKEEDIKFECRKPMFDFNEFIHTLDYSREANYFSGKEYTVGKVEQERVDLRAVWPQSVQVRFFADLGDGENLLASGTIIGPNIVLTCAHNVYKRETGNHLDKGSTTLYPCLNELTIPYRSLNVIEIYYPEEFKNDENEDYALLVLNRRIGDYTGYFGIKEWDRKSLKNRKKHKYGHTAEIMGQIENENHFCRTEGDLTINPSNRMMSNMIATSSGIYIEENGEYYIIGLKAQESDSYRLQSQAVYLNQARVRRIRGFIQEYYQQYNVIKEIDSYKLEKAYEVLISMHDNGMNLDDLKTLKLRDHNLKPSHISKLAKFNFPRLAILNLSGNHFGSSVPSILHHMRFFNLKELDLSNNQIGDEGADGLYQAHFPYLKELKLWGNEIGDKGAISLSSANFPFLQTLNLYHNQIGDSGVKKLSKSCFINLKILNLSQNKIRDEGAISLSSANFPILETLNLSDNRIRDEGTIALSRAMFLNLSDLNLSRNQIGDLGATALFRASFQKLNRLDLERNQIEAIALSQVNILCLKELNLSVNHIGEEAANMIRDKFTRTNIRI